MKYLILILLSFVFYSCESSWNNVSIDSGSKEGTNVSEFIFDISGNDSIINFDLKNCKCVYNDTILVIDIFRSNGWILDDLHLEIESNNIHSWIIKETDISHLRGKFQDFISLDISNSVFDSDSINGYLELDQEIDLVESGSNQVIKRTISFIGEFECLVEKRNLSLKEVYSPSGKKKFIK